MDRLIVGAVLGPSAVTLVEIATQVQNGSEAVLSASSYSVVPTSSWLRARSDDDSLRELLETGTRYSLLVTYPIVALTAILAGPLVGLWVGADYAAAPGLAVVAVLYVALTAPLQVGSNLLLGVGRAGTILRAAALAVAVNFVASLILVHAVGIVGVLIGSLVGTALLVPMLGRSMLAEVGVRAWDFVRQAVLPVVVALLPLVAVAGAVVALPLADLPTVASACWRAGPPTPSRHPESPSSRASSESSSRRSSGADKEGMAVTEDAPFAPPIRTYTDPEGRPFDYVHLPHGGSRGLVVHSAPSSENGASPSRTATGSGAISTG